MKPSHQSACAEFSDSSAMRNEPSMFAATSWNRAPPARAEPSVAKQRQPPPAQLPPEKARPSSTRASAPACAQTASCATVRSPAAAPSGGRPPIVPARPFPSHYDVGQF